jgi:hypothetical protein
MGFRPKSNDHREYIVGKRLEAIERGDWEQKIEDYKAGRVSVPPIGGAMPTKDRWSLVYGLQGRESGWEIPDLVEYDYAYLNLVGATTFNGMILGVMPGTNAPLIGSPDPIGTAITAAIGGRVVGSGPSPYYTCLSCWVFLRTNAGTVYTAAAGTTLTLNVVSAGANANQALTALTAAFLVNGATQFWTQMPILTTIPAERQVSIGQPGTGAVAGSTVIPGVAAGYYGDVLMGQLVTTGALNIQGNSMVMVLELA